MIRARNLAGSLPRCRVSLRMRHDAFLTCMPQIERETLGAPVPLNVGHTAASVRVGISVQVALPVHEVVLVGIGGGSGT